MVHIGGTPEKNRINARIQRSCGKGGSRATNFDHKAQSLRYFSTSQPSLRSHTHKNVVDWRRSEIPVQINCMIHKRKYTNGVRKKGSKNGVQKKGSRFYRIMSNRTGFRDVRVMAAPSKLRKSMQHKWWGWGWGATTNEMKRKHENEYSTLLRNNIWVCTKWEKEKIQRGKGNRAEGGRKKYKLLQYASKRASSFTCDSRSTLNFKVTWKYSRTSFFPIFIFLVGASQIEACCGVGGARTTCVWRTEKSSY